MVPLGYLVTRAHAWDADVGSNANVTYLISFGDEDGDFEMEPDEGTITVAGDFSQIDENLFELEIIAEDNGMPNVLHSPI